MNGEVPMIALDAISKNKWNVRNFGWFPPFGGGPTVPSVTQRTANETAEGVQFIERNYRQTSSPSE